MIDCAAPASVGLLSLPFVSSEKATSKRAPKAYAMPSWVPCQFDGMIYGEAEHTMTHDMKKSVPKTAMSI